MTLCLDHIFVCTSLGAPESELLIDAGFVEGTPNTHPGQGTSNRRFFFEHGFLEFLWVHDEREVTSSLTGRTRLWERWSQRDRHANPFGICFSSPAMADPPLPFPTWIYEPRYLPQGKRIYFAEGTTLAEPELFVLGWPQPPASAAPQPRVHGLPFRSMRAVSVGLSDTECLSEPMRAARDTGLVRVHRASAPELVVEFSSPTSTHLHIPSLRITLCGRPDDSA
jgi:hypothetical protein